MLFSSVVLVRVLWSCELQVQLFQTFCDVLRKKTETVLSLPSLSPSLLHLSGACFLTLLCSVREKKWRWEGEVVETWQRV